MRLPKGRKVEVNGSVPDPEVPSQRDWAGVLRPVIAERQFDANEQHPWTHPPVFSPERDALIRAPLRLLEQLGGLLRRPLDAWHIHWIYWTQVAAATDERDTLVNEIREWVEKENHARAEQRRDYQNLIEQEEGRLKALDDQLAAEQDSFASVVGAAGLGGSVDPDGLPQAVQENAPDLRELAGAEGIIPVEDSARSDLNRFLGQMAPVVSGALLALCLGTLVGLVKLSDLSRTDRLGKFFVVAFIGWVIAWILGEVVAHSTAMLARALENRRHGVPGLRCELPIAVGSMLAATVCALAEVAVEAYGLHDLHQQHLVQAKRLSLDVSSLPDLPIWFYALIGSIITGPYLLYRAISQWGMCSQEQRRAWLLHRRREWVGEICRSGPIQQAFEHSRRIQRLERDRNAAESAVVSWKGKLEMLHPISEADPIARERAREAELVAVAEAERFHKIIEQMISEERESPSG